MVLWLTTRSGSAAASPCGRTLALDRAHERQRPARDVLLRPVADLPVRLQLRRRETSASSRSRWISDGMEDWRDQPSL